MKNFTFTYTEVSLAGRHDRRWECKAATEKSAWSKLFAMMGNRTFDDVKLVSSPLERKNRKAAYVTAEGYEVWDAGLQRWVKLDRIQGEEFIRFNRIATLIFAKEG